MGAEIEAAWHPSPELTFTASLGVTDVELREFRDPFTGQDFSGRRAPYAPEHEAHLGATYRAKAGWFAAADAVVTGETHFDESESAAATVGTHTVLHGRVGYETTRWRLSIYGENLTSEDYYTLIIPGVAHAVPGAPSTWGVEAVVKW